MSRTPSHVYSTATTPFQVVKYTEYVPNAVPLVLASVTIQGGANVPDKFMRTPRGVATPITSADYDLLIADKLFLKMMTDGFVSFGNSADDAEAASRGMTAKDRSAPKTAADYERIPNNMDGLGIRTGRSVEEIARPG